MNFFVGVKFQLSFVEEKNKSRRWINLAKFCKYANFIRIVWKLIKIFSQTYLFLKRLK